MVWGYITGYGLGSLIFVDGSVNALKYKTIIQEQVLPTYEDLTQHTAEPIFQDDSAPCHQAHTVKKIIFLFTSKSI